MRGQNIKTKKALCLASMAIVLIVASEALSEVQATYLYNLSSFTGGLPFMWARVTVDDIYNEVYVVYGNDVKIFNQRGMEEHEIKGFDMDIGALVDVAVNEDGNILAFAYYEAAYSITLCNYRGEPVEKLAIKNLPPEFSDWKPNRMFYREGTFYLVGMNTLKAVVLDSKAVFKDAYDLASIIGLEGKPDENEIFGLSIGQNGDFMFTLGVEARAYVVSRDRKMKVFGKRGSAPGRFGVPAGIVQDSAGHYLVADMLRGVILIFDKDLKFVTEFGSRGLRPGQLIVPRDLAIDKEDRLYVNQGRYRGVSVFKIKNTGVNDNG